MAYNVGYTKAPVPTRQPWVTNNPPTMSTPNGGPTPGKTAGLNSLAAGITGAATNIGNTFKNRAPGTKGAPDPGSGNNYSNPAPPATDTAGSQSGPGILESWFNQRANGTDPGYEYALKRNSDALDSRMAAGGSYNSGARTQGLSDMYANMEAQREGQLDALAGGASGEHQGRVNSMFQQMLGLAGGQSGINSAYDITAAGGMSQALAAMLGLEGGKAGVDSAANQGLINNLLTAAAVYKSKG